MLDSLNVDSVIENKKYIDKIFSLAEQAKQIVESYNNIMESYSIIEQHLISQLDCDKITFSQGSVEVDKKIVGKITEFSSTIKEDLPISEELRSKLKLQIELDFDLSNEKLAELTNLLYEYVGDNFKIKTTIHQNSLNSILTKYYKELCKELGKDVSILELAEHIKDIDFFKIYKLKVKDKEGNSLLPKIKL